MRRQWRERIAHLRAPVFDELLGESCQFFGFGCGEGLAQFAHSELMQAIARAEERIIPLIREITFLPIELAKGGHQRLRRGLLR